MNNKGTFFAIVGTLGAILCIATVFIMVSHDKNREKAIATTLTEMEVTQESLSRATVHYAVRCQKCHGQQGKGTRVAPSLADETWIYGGTLESIYDTIANGSPNGRMPAWGGKLKPVDIQSIAVHVARFPSQ